VMLALYPPAIFFDGLVQKTGLGLLLTSSLLALLALFQRQRSAASIAACGATLGLLALTRENALIFALAIPIWIALRFYEVSARQRAAWLAIFLLGLAAVLLPVGLRNRLVGDTFAITTSQLGTNFYIGNNPDATGVYAPLVPGRHSPRFEGPDAARLAEQALGRPLSKGEVSSYWLERGLRFAREQPLDWLALLARKLLLTWNAFEVPDTEDIYVAGEWSWLLRGLLAFFHFGVLLPLALAGMHFAWTRRPDSLLLYWLTAVFTGATALFYVFARYRFPLVPLLLPFAALAAVETARHLRHREFAELAWPIALFSFTAVVANLSLVEPEPLHAVAYMNLGGIELQQGRLAEAERYLERGETLNPDYADLQLHLGLLRLAQGRLPEAEAHLRRTLALVPGDPRARRALALLRTRESRSGPQAQPTRDPASDPH
jgi:tetratricopeptide (TPR) repeat protein